MNNYPWYGLADGDQLRQGDLFFSCPYDCVEDDQIVRKKFDIVVLSQSCDLAHDKLEIVQVCPFWTLEVLGRQVEFFRSKRGREELRRGNLPGYHLLNRCTLPGGETDFLVVDFRSQFAVNRVLLKTLATQQPSRLRVLPPYREHLAQSLARFFMRVGLPIDIPAF